MLEELKTAKKLVGTRRVLRAVREGKVAKAFVGDDADLFILRELRAACEATGTRLVKADSMKLLGEACGVDVPTASAAILY